MGFPYHTGLDAAGRYSSQNPISWNQHRNDNGTMAKKGPDAMETK